ncbi:acetyltransferase, GNAT family [Ancylostoma ceylanicum]|uniref:Acetyltransferase, GNAT family n=1 Tax=Ancylostoma ceylanicum TaxID=53326 RepID=A0A0D6LGQ7_9BILA|nr:acetyltransferase, GNAT family [Ancylostoma ceylanicum]
MRLNENVKIIGKNVILVPYEKDHVPKYHSWMEDEELRRLTGSERLSLDDEYKMQQSWRTDEDKLTFIILSRAMVDSGSAEQIMFLSSWKQPIHFQVDSMIGDVNLFLQSEDNAGELEVMVAEKPARGSGVGTEAVSLMISYAMNELPVERFFVKITDDNSASLHLFEDKLHFRRVSHSEAFKEHTLELPLSETESFRGLLGSATLAQYRS